jgi:hypothetical protein
MIIRFIEPQIGDLELSEDVIVPITLSVGDIRDVQKKSGSFSKTIIVPGTKNNNSVLRHLYDYNIVDDFGVNKIKRCQLIDNDDLIVKDNLIFQLVKVAQRQNNNLFTDEVDWECIVKDSVSDFFTKINNLELTDISRAKFEQYNHIWNSLGVIGSFSNTEIDGFKYWLYNLPQPQLFVTSPIYEIKDIPLAIYAKKYWDWIHAEAGYSYEWDTLSDIFVQFDKLLVTDNKNREELLKEIASLSRTRGFFVQSGSNYHFGYRAQYNSVANDLTNLNDIRVNLQFPDEIEDLSNILSYSSTNYGGTLGTKFVNSSETLSTSIVPSIPPPSIALPPGNTIITKNSSNSVILKATVEANLKINFQRRTPGNDFQLRNNGSVGNNRPKVEVWLNVVNLTTSATSNQLIRRIFPQDVQTVYNGGVVTLQENLILDEIVFVELDLVGDLGDQFLLSWEVNFIPSPSGSNSFTFEDVVTNSIQPVDPWFYIGNSTITLGDDSLDVGDPMPVFAWVPKKIKQSDFIKSIATMYNLFAVADPLNPNNIIWKHRDNFYDEGVTLDWSYKLDKESDQDLTFLPELVNKKLVLTYKSDSDSYNKTYTEATKEIYGQQEVIFNSDFVKDTDTKEIIFSPTPFGQSIFGASVPYIDTPNLSTCRILIDSGVNACSGYIISNNIPNPQPIDFANLKAIINANYPLTIHWSGPFGGGVFDINFGPCDFYYLPVTEDKVPTTNLYNLYWRRTAAQIDNGRLLEAYFWLNNNDISTLQLNSKIKLDNSYWIINKVIDYNPNNPQLTKVELLSLEDTVALDTRVVNTAKNSVTPTNDLKANQLVPKLEQNIRSSRVLTNDTVILLTPNQTVQPGTKGFIIDETHSLTKEAIKFGNITIFEDHIEDNGNPFNPFAYYSEDTGMGIAEIEVVDGGEYSTLSIDKTSSTLMTGDLTTVAAINTKPSEVNLSVTDGLSTNEIRVTLTETIMTLPSYADEADATLAGLQTGTLYQTDGTGAAPLNVAGIVMIKQ